jgi:hypothetical protein
MKHVITSIQARKHHVMRVSLSPPISPSSAKTPVVQLATVILGSTIVFAKGIASSLLIGSVLLATYRIVAVLTCRRVTRNHSPDGGRVPSPPTQGPANRDGMVLNEGQMWVPVSAHWIVPSVNAYMGQAR